jgi:hypothetical protein
VRREKSERHAVVEEEEEKEEMKERGKNKGTVPGIRYLLRLI